jgi:uncharacterized membrane protein YebE (DUF533 family)
MFKLNELLEWYFEGENKAVGESSDKAGNFGGLAGGALAGGLAGLLAGTRTGRKIGINALAYGGTAVLGGLAYKAWRDWHSGKPAISPQTTIAADQSVLPLPPPDSPFLPQPGQEADFSRALVRAMIGAAKADVEIDARERQRILERAEELRLDAEMRVFVLDELAGPLDFDEITAPAVSPETAAEIYAASLLAVDLSGAAEQGYLSMLAARLKLEPGLVEHLHANVEQALSAG